MKRKRILILEDEELERRSLLKDFSKPSEVTPIGPMTFECKDTASAKECSRIYSEEFFDLVILDLRVREGDGITVLKRIREEDLTTPVLVLSGEAQQTDMQEIGRHPNTYFFHKDFTGTGASNPRFQQCIKCLCDGEALFRKTHRDFWLPPPLICDLLDSSLYNSAILVDLRRDILRYLRNPQKGFRGKGAIQLLSKVEDVIAEHIETLGVELLGGVSDLSIEDVISKIRGPLSLSKMEQFLSLDPTYREHFMHQVQDFLLGCVVYHHFKGSIDAASRPICERFADGKRVTDDIVTKFFETGWFFASMFHDFGFPVQRHDQLVSKYFRENYCYRFPPSGISTDTPLLREGLDAHFGAISDDFWASDVREEEFRLLLLHEFTEKNHAIHSSVALRKLIRYNETGEGFANLFTPVYSAIAMHDWRVWSKSSVIAKYLELNHPDAVDAKGFRYNLEFRAPLERNPFLHLLLLADNMQRWGRPLGREVYYASDHIELADIQLDTGGGKPSLVFELNVMEGLDGNTSEKTYCEYCRTFKTTQLMLGDGGLPVSAILNRGFAPNKAVKFDLGSGVCVDCSVTAGCPKA